MEYSAGGGSTSAPHHPPGLPRARTGGNGGGAVEDRGQLRVLPRLRAPVLVAHRPYRLPPPATQTTSVGTRPTRDRQFPTSPRPPALRGHHSGVGQRQPLGLVHFSDRPSRAWQRQRGPPTNQHRARGANRPPTGGHQDRAAPSGPRDRPLSVSGPQTLGVTQRGHAPRERRHSRWNARGHHRLRVRRTPGRVGSAGSLGVGRARRSRPGAGWSSPRCATRSRRWLVAASRVRARVDQDAVAVAGQQSHPGDRRRSLQPDSGGVAHRGG